MIQILNFVSSIALLLYAGCAFIILLAVRSWWLAQRERRRTIYGLEKEVAGERALRALVIALLTLGIGALVYYADANAVPIPDAPQRSPTPNLALFITPTATVPPPSPTPAPPTPTPLRGGTTAGTPTVVSPLPRVTVTLPPAPPTAPPAAPGCPNAQARIVSPGVNAHLTGVVNVVGSASIANFQYYKVEYGAGEQPSHWNVIGDLRRTQVSDGILQTFNAGAFPPGVYYLRLTVVDQTGNFPIAPCAVRVFIGS